MCGVEDFYKTLEEKPKEALLCISAAVAMHKVQIYIWDAILFNHVAHVIFIFNHQTSHNGNRFNFSKVMTVVSMTSQR